MKKRNDRIDTESVPAQENKKKRRRKGKLLRRCIVLLLVVALLGGVVWLGYNRLKEEYTVTYQAYTATVGTITNSLSFSGTLQTINNTTYTASSAATVKTIYVDKMADVKAGDQLMRLNNGTIIEAEFDGRVNQLPVSAGSKVASGDTLIQIVDFSHMKVNIRVDEYDIADVRVGDEVTVTLTAAEKTFNSVIDDINYVSSSSGSVAYYTATAYVDVEGDVYPGMQVTVTIPQEEAADVVVLKEDALSFDGTNKAFVYTRSEDGTMETTYVETGVSNGNYVEIKEGLLSGDVVYAVAEKTESSGLAGLMSTLFGGQRFTGGQMPGGGTNRSNWNQGDRGNFGSGDWPSMPSRDSSGGGGNR